MNDKSRVHSNITMAGTRGGISELTATCCQGVEASIFSRERKLIAQCPGRE
jgi:hypothetical protein